MKMTSADIKKTIIDKWMPIFFKGESTQPCHLCLLVGFHCISVDLCVISQHTGSTGCLDTPFWSYYTNPCRDTAREELLFLIMLYKKHKKLEGEGIINKRAV